MQYQHTQPGWVIRFTCLICLCIPLGLNLAFNQGRFPLYEMLPVGAIMLAVVTFFHSLTVRIDSESMRVKFGVGLVAYNFLLKDIQSVEPVRSPWYCGWGIRKIRGGWLLNVSGFESVEIHLRTGKVYRIGTDDQGGLLAALKASVTGEVQ